MSLNGSEWSDLDVVENNQRNEQLALNIPAFPVRESMEAALTRGLAQCVPVLPGESIENALAREGIYVGESEEPLPWSDSLILGTYKRSVENGLTEASIQKAAAEEAKKKEAAAIKDKFPNGSYCRALYSGDGCYYEGKVILLKEYTCMVEFVGYKNREEVELKNLKPSKGKRTRKNQIKVANETYAMNLTYASASQEANCVHLRDYELRMSAGPAENTLNMPAAYYAPPEVPQNMACLAPPPVPPMPPSSSMNNSMSAMLMSWYMAGYYTGLHQNQKEASCSARPCCHGHY